MARKMKSSGPGRIDGLFRVFEHGSRRDSEFPGEGLRLAFRVREIPDGRVPLVPDALRRAKRDSTGVGDAVGVGHGLRSQREYCTVCVWSIRVLRVVGASGYG